MDSQLHGNISLDKPEQAVMFHLGGSAKVGHLLLEFLLGDDALGDSSLLCKRIGVGGG